MHSVIWHLSKASLELQSPLDWHLGSVEVLLDPPGALLGASWSLLGRSWRPLGASWGALGGLLAPLECLLGRLGSDPKRHQDDMPKKVNFQTNFRPQRLYFSPPQKEAKINQNRTQNASKFETIFKSEKIALREPLGAVLGSSWRILEAILESEKALAHRET